MKKRMRSSKGYRYVGRLSIPWTRIKKLWWEEPDSMYRPTHGFLCHVITMDNQQYLIERNPGILKR